MKTISIKTLEDLQKLDLNNFTVTEDIEIHISLKIIDKKVNYPIVIKHNQPDLVSNIKIKAALYGNSELIMPVEIIVNHGAKNTKTGFNAIVYILSSEARARITPGLFIHEKEILGAGHGLIIKNIKDRDTVYLESRGIQKSEAREMIVNL